MSQTFLPKNESFTCVHCKKHVEKSLVGYRNHCPFCLYGLHVDIHPGDRASTCRGVLEPVGIQKDAKRTWMIVFRCQQCGERKRNKVLADDDTNVVTALSKFPT